MDLAKLAADWATDPALSAVSSGTVEELAEHLLRAHRYLNDPAQAGPLCYLYQQQIRINRELKEQLKTCQAALSQPNPLPPTRDK